MTGDDRRVTFREYFGRMLAVVFACSLALSLLIAVIMFIVGDFSMDLNVDIELDRAGALFILVGLPAIALIVFALLSPLSWQICRLVCRFRPRQGS